jgi:hypothetical protein
MAAIKSDVIAGAGIQQDASGNYSMTRVFTVSQLSPSAANPSIIQALAVPGIPKRGDVYPNSPSNPPMRAYNIRSAPDGPAAAMDVRVTVDYFTPNASLPPLLGEKPRVRVGAVVTTQETQFAYISRSQLTSNSLTPPVLGQTIYNQGGQKPSLLMQVKAIGIDIPSTTGVNGVAIPGKTVTPPPQFPTATYFQPLPSISIVRREPSNAILLNAANWVGSINVDTWNGLPPGLVVCTGINGVSDDGENTFIVTYEFQVNVSQDLNGNYTGWSALQVWRDPSTGQIQYNPRNGSGANQAPGIVPGVNYKWYQVQPGTIFANLQLNNL